MERMSENIPAGVTIDVRSSPDSSPLTSANGKTDYMRIGLIVVILLFLGINVFSYLGDFFQRVKEFFTPLLKSVLGSLGYVVTESTKDVTQLTAEGAKLGIDVAAGTVESGIDVIQGQLDIVQDDSQSHQQIPRQPHQMGQQHGNNQQMTRPMDKLSASLSSALADAEYNTEPLPDDATSSTQRVSPGKSGYCYIGEDRGFRSCIEVKGGDMCMSGDIFPSQSICVNPSLRE
jgi:hypothetical protein|tara:strand:- start:2163 stop:2858 length:696 start_codon:yes stop_codon:yes gene_type:complete